MIRLFTTYYDELRDARRAELEYCIAINASTFDGVFVLSEGVEICGPWVRVIDHRQQFADLVRWAAEEAAHDDVSIIANCDIVFPAKALELIGDSLLAGEAYCLSRHDVTAGGGAKLFDFEYSQDAWAFRGPPNVTGGEYFFGIPGSDNKFAHEIEQSGYRVSNPSRTIKILHLHQSGRRTATNSRAHRVQPPYLFVKPMELMGVIA